MHHSSRIDRQGPYGEAGEVGQKGHSPQAALDLTMPDRSRPPSAGGTLARLAGAHPPAFGSEAAGTVVEGASDEGPADCAGIADGGVVGVGADDGVGNVPKEKDCLAPR